MRAENDTGSGGNNCRFITFDSGWSTDANSPPRMSGLTSEQLAWMKEDQKQAYTNGKTHTFIITHGPIVGHGGKGTHNELGGTDHDHPFVEWVNGEDSEYPEGQYVEAVFVGHTHENWIFCNVTIDNIDNPTGNDIVPLGIPLPFSWYALYIETTTATKWYG